jgi:hypothetical protein
MILKASVVLGNVGAWLWSRAWNLRGLRFVSTVMEREAKRHRTARSERAESGSGRSGRLLIELGIIFAGVFGAFVAEDVRQTREDEARARQIYAALSGEVSTFAAGAPHVVAHIDGEVAEWNAARQEGRVLPPPFYREPRAEVPPTAIYEATLASGGVALLDPELFNQVATFYNRLSSLSERYLRYNAFTESRILPGLLGEPSAFYDDTGALRAEFRTHMDRMNEIRQELAQLEVEAAVLLRELAGEL